jgi:SAM-dependent methyltransferase
MNAPPRIFDRRLYRRRRARAAASFGAHDFLHRRAMADVVDRLESVNSDFPHALFYGVGGLTTMLTEKAGVGRIIEADLAAARLAGAGVTYDEEAAPFAPAAFDLVVSLLTLHAANDLIGALTQIRLSLKPDGLMIAVLFGEETLRELRAAFHESEAAIAGGVSPRVAPFASVRELGAALQRAGFAMPVADVDRVDVRYRAPDRLLADLRRIGETNCLADRGRALRRDALYAAMERISAQSTTFDLVTITGWAPGPGQPTPLKPGSATRSLERAISEY